MNMRWFLLFLATFLLWSGTVSIRLNDQPLSILPAFLSCSAEGEGRTLLEYFYAERISHIHDNGRVLTVNLSSQWSALPSGVQHATYQAIACYAQSQRRMFQLVQQP